MVTPKMGSQIIDKNRSMYSLGLTKACIFHSIGFRLIYAKYRICKKPR